MVFAVKNNNSVIVTPYIVKGLLVVEDELG